MFNKIRNIKIWAVSNVPEGSEDIEFENNLVTFLWDKKQLNEYICNSYVLQNVKHYKQWLDYRELEDNTVNKVAYIKSDPESFMKYAGNFSIKRYSYDHNAIASIIRLLATAIPVGSSYENELETAAYNKALLAILAEEEKEADGNKQEG